MDWKWEIHPKVIDNERTKILWGFQIQTDKRYWLTNKKAVVIDVAISNDSNIKKKEHEKGKKNKKTRTEVGN